MAATPDTLTWRIHGQRDWRATVHEVYKKLVMTEHTVFPKLTHSITFFPQHSTDTVFHNMFPYSQDLSETLLKKLL